MHSAKIKQKLPCCSTLHLHCIFSGPPRENRLYTVSLNTGPSLSLQLRLLRFLHLSAPLSFAIRLSMAGVHQHRRARMCFQNMLNSFHFNIINYLIGLNVYMKRKVKRKWSQACLHISRFCTSIQLNVASFRIASSLLSYRPQWKNKKGGEKPCVSRSGLVQSSDPFSIDIKWEWEAWISDHASPYPQSSCINRGEQRWRRTAWKHTQG